MGYHPGGDQMGTWPGGGEEPEGESPGGGGKAPGGGGRQGGRLHPYYICPYHHQPDVTLVNITLASIYWDLVGAAHLNGKTHHW